MRPDVEIKSSPKFSKNGPKVATAVFTSKVMFSKSLKSHPTFGIFFKENFTQRIFKNRPAWSHWICDAKSEHLFSLKLTFLLAMVCAKVRRRKRLSQENIFCFLTLEELSIETFSLFSTMALIYLNSDFFKVLDSSLALLQYFNIQVQNIR